MRQRHGLHAGGEAAVVALRANGVTVFASAGNNSSGSLMGAPACLSNVVAVGATDTADDVAGFSNSNSATDVFAPGVDVVSDATGGGTISLSGTSMASPTAATCAALIRRARPTATPAAIETTLESTGVAVTDVTHGLTFPRIDCAAAVGPVGGAPTVSISDAGVAEGNSVTRPATFAVSLPAASTQTVSVRYATADGTAVAPGDYTAEAGTLLTFQPGQTSTPVTVTVTGDAVVEPDETFTVNLATPTNTTIADGVGVGTITDDDTAGTLPTVSICDTSVVEGNSATRPATFTVSLSAASAQPVSVRAASANGTAVAPGGYTAKASTC